MRTSESIKAISAALAQFQGEVKNPKTSKEVRVPGKEGRSGYSYHYTPLNDVMDAVRPVLAKFGLAVIQSTSAIPIDTAKADYKTGAVYKTTVLSPSVTTRITHSSGEWIESEELSFLAGTGAQDVGSALSYARRYQLAGMLGIAPDDDDDANGADGVEGSIEAKPTQASAPRPQAARGFGEVDLTGGALTLEEALAYAPFKSGPDAGKAMRVIDDGKLSWLANNEKTSAKTKQMAKMVLDSRRPPVQGTLGTDETDETMAEEPPDEYMGFAPKGGRD